MGTETLFAFDAQYPGLVAGVDEAGRGPLAGPVVAAACIMPRDAFIDGIDDSKRLSAAARERLYERITETAAAFAVAVVAHTVIDEINILNATKLAMRRVVEQLRSTPDIVLIDAVKLDLPVRTVSIVKGDAKSYAIAAASILAKVTRDRMMRRYDEEYPGYGFAKNKGYGTAEHIRALAELGPSPIHRRTFRVKGGAHVAQSEQE